MTQVVQCLEKGQNKDRMEATFESLDEELKGRWSEFIANALNPSLKEQQDELGGPLGTSSPSFTTLHFQFQLTHSSSQTV